MSLANVNHFKLRRSHKDLKKAFNQKNWQALREQDRELARSIDRLLIDSSRDTKALIDDLKGILATYSEIIAEVPGDVERHVFSPNKQV